MATRSAPNPSSGLLFFFCQCSITLVASRICTFWIVGKVHALLRVCIAFSKFLQVLPQNLIWAIVKTQCMLRQTGRRLMNLFRYFSVNNWKQQIPVMSACWTHDSLGKKHFQRSKNNGFRCELQKLVHAAIRCKFLSTSLKSLLRLACLKAFWTVICRKPDLPDDFNIVSHEIFGMWIIYSAPSQTPNRTDPNFHRALKEFSLGMEITSHLIWQNSIVSNAYERKHRNKHSWILEVYEKEWEFKITSQFLEYWN